MSPAAASPVSSESIYAEVRLNRQLRRLENEGGIGWPIIIGVAASIAMHAALLIPQVRELLLAASESHNGSKARQASFSVEKEVPKPPALTPEEEEELTKLGIEDGTTKSTMTWIGYKDFQEHLAKLSQVDQAAFRESDTGGQPMQAQPEQAASTSIPPPSLPAPETPPAAPAMAQAEAPAGAAAPAPAPPSTATNTAPLAPSVPPPPVPSSLALPQTPAAANPAEAVPVSTEPKIEGQVLPVERVGDAKAEQTPPEPLKPDAPPPPESKPTDEKPNDLKPNEAKPSDAKPEETQPQEAKPTDKPEDAKPQEQPAPQPGAPAAPAQPSATAAPAQPAAPNQPQPPAQQAADAAPAQPDSQPGSKPGPKSSGDISDRESEASSTIDVPPSKWRNGRPLAAKGLNVRTQRPIFDELTSVTAAPENPIIEIEFDREGVPKKCTILQSSGTSLVDQPILDCLYRWRASGSQLAKLPEGKTLKFRIRMLLR